MNSWLAVALLVIGTLVLWGIALWLFGVFGILFFVLSGYTFPIWGLILLEAWGEGNNYDK